MPSEKDREIFDELRTLGKGVARIDERTERMDKEWWYICRKFEVAGAGK